MIQGIHMLVASALRTESSGASLTFDAVAFIIHVFEVVILPVKSISTRSTLVHLERGRGGSKAPERLNAKLHRCRKVQRKLFKQAVLTARRVTDTDLMKQRDRGRHGQASSHLPTQHDASADL